MNVEDFVKEHGGKYRNYRGGWLIQCPYHSDNSPSCSLSITGLFNCWSCGEKGNYTRLLHDVAKFSWKRATETVSTLNLRKHWTRREKRIYEQSESPTISSAVLGLYDVDWVAAYEVYSAHKTRLSVHRPPWALVFDKGFLPGTLTHFDVGYDKEDQRIMIPVWNDENQLYGVVGRACRPQEFKYVPYHGLKYSDHVYNLQNTQEGEPVILVEGAFDVWMVWQWRSPLTAVATMTSHASEQQMTQILEKHAHIFVLYDNDMAGWKGADKAARALTKRGGKVDIIFTPEGITDIKQMTRDQFWAQLDARKPYPCQIGDLQDNPHYKATVPSRRVHHERAR